ncbi:MAG: phosphatidate cytidylyltransferase [Rhodospirillaceae bacterium]
MSFVVETGATDLYQAENMFWKRVATSMVLGPITLVTVYLGFPYFHVMVVLISACVFSEFVQIVGERKLSLRIIIAILTLVVGVAVAEISAIYAVTLVAILGLVLLLTDQSHRRFSIASIHVALLYAALPSITIIMVYTIGGVETMFWLLAIVWGTDIGAYVLGRLIGGPKLASRISPNKTWSGAIGGVLLAIVALILVDFIYSIGLQSIHFVYAISVSILAQLGDLAQSSFKRKYNVKDSGRLLPGHGGVMDRVDGLWTASPLVAVLCVANSSGVTSWL